MKKIYVLFLVLMSCVPELPDCDSKADAFQGVWVLSEVYIDGSKEDATSYAAYRLTLKENGSYERRQPSGFPDSGTWQLINQDKTLSLVPNVSPEEQYVVETFTLREMTLVLNRSSTKSGPSQIRYVLIPDIE